MMAIVTMAFTVHAQMSVVNLDDNTAFVKPATDPSGIRRPPATANRSGDVTPVSFLASDKEQGVRISTGPSFASSYTAQHRQIVMAGLGGVSVTHDRTNVPSAYYPLFGKVWQLWEAVSSTNTNFKLWLGTEVPGAPATTNELGCRMLVHSAGRFPVSNYWCRVIASSTNYGSAFFQVGMNSTNGEIAFNPQFVGIWFGTNGVLDSYISPISGMWVQAGDDAVYTNGELPSQVPYDWWYRYGATIVVNIGNKEGFIPLQREFAATNQTFTAELIVRSGGVDTVVDSQILDSAAPRLGIRNNNNGDHQVLLSVEDGQTLLSYDILTHTEVEKPVAEWTQIHLYQGMLFHQQWNEGAPDFKRFYQARSKAP